MPDGDPQTCKIIQKMNWTGVGLEIARDSWGRYRERTELLHAGVYLLVGYQEDEDKPTLYIGQGDGIKSRIDSHEKRKPFWDRALVFVSSNHGLNRAHITWLEWALVQRAQRVGRCKLDNAASPNEPILTESEKADTRAFLNEILSILPLVQVPVFQQAKKIKADTEEVVKVRVMDTIVVPAQEEGFNDVFLGENCWHAIRIGGGKLREIKYIAAYQTNPISAVTHYAEVESIEPYGDGEKYQLNFKGPAIPMEPIQYGNAKRGSMQSPRYTSFEKLKKARVLNDLFR